MIRLPPPLGDACVYRQHRADGCLSQVWYSHCDRYRYGLARSWDVHAPALLFVMLNPSTADEYRNDPTVARCETRARRMGFGTVMIANVFAWRATRPQDLRASDDPVGDLNDALLENWVRQADMTVAAWGVHGGYLDRGPQVARRIPGDLHHLGLTLAGHPRHPLYVALDRQPALWPVPDRYLVEMPPKS